MAFAKHDRKEKKEIPFDVMLRNFKRSVERSGKLKDLADREFFTSRGTKRRRSKEEAVRRSKRNLRKAREEHHMQATRRKHGG